MKLDSLNLHSEILIDEEIGDIVRGRMSSEAHRVVLKSLKLVYGENSKINDLISVESGKLLKLLEEWRHVFESAPHNHVFEDSELSFYNLGRKLLALRTS